MPGRGVAVPDRVALPPDPALGVGDVEVGAPPGRRRSGPPGRPGTRSGDVVGRTCATHRNRAVAPIGTHSSRSAKDRSESSCQSPASRCRWSMSALAEVGVLLDQIPQRGHTRSLPRHVDNRVRAFRSPWSARAGDPDPRPGPAPAHSASRCNGRMSSNGAYRSSTAGVGDAHDARRYVGRPDRHHVRPALPQPGHHVPHRPAARPVADHGQHRYVRIGHGQRPVQQVGTGERERRQIATSPSASARPPGRSGTRTRGRW